MWEHLLGCQHWRYLRAQLLSHVLVGHIGDALHGQHVEDGVARLNVMTNGLDDELHEVMTLANQHRNEEVALPEGRKGGRQAVDTMSSTHVHA